MQPPKRILQIRHARQDKLLAWYAKQPRATRLQIHKEKLRVFRIWVAERQDAEKQEFQKEELDYLALLAGIAEIRRLIDEPKKARDFKLKAEQAVGVGKKYSRDAPIQSRIENDFLPLIHELRKQGLAWRGIQEYIRVNHYKRYGVSTLHKVYRTEYGDNAI
jgi:hypothetical protein